MSIIQHLASQALLGTEKRPLDIPVDDSEIGKVLQAILQSNATATDSTLDHAIQLLRAAGVLAVCGQSGYMPELTVKEEPVSPAKEETDEVLQNTTLVGALGLILEEDSERLCQEVLRLMATKKLLLPPRLLPQWLEKGRRIPSLRSTLSAVVGERGHWLSRQNSAWNIFTTTTEGLLDVQVWELGTLDQRKSYLSSIRQQDAEQGRVLLAQALDTLNARERATLLSTFESGLSIDDEDFIEPMLRDRGKEVRQTAATLLTSLPESRYVNRMIERLAPCVTIQPKLTLEPPEAFGCDWKNDTLEETKSQSEELGQRAWWLYQIASHVPLSWWQMQTGLTPEELLAWAKESDWEAALLRAWLEVLEHERNIEWAHALLKAMPTGKASHYRAKVHIDAFSLINMLPIAQRESHWLQLLTIVYEKRPLFTLGELFEHITRSIPSDASSILSDASSISLNHSTSPSFSVEFSRGLIQALHAWVNHERAAYDYELRRSIVDFACLLPTQMLDEPLLGWPHSKDGAIVCEEVMTRLCATLAHRKTLYQFFA